MGGINLATAVTISIRFAATFASQRAQLLIAGTGALSLSSEAATAVDLPRSSC